MKLQFISLYYDYVDIEGKAIVRVFGKTAEGKRVCVIDSCDAFFWVLPEQDLSVKEIEKLMDKIKNVKSEAAGRKVYVKNASLHDKNFLGKAVKAIKVVVSNPKDMGVVGELVKEFDGVDMKREIDIPYITRYILEKNVKPLQWYSIDGDLLGNSLELRGMDAVLDVDFVVKAKKIEEAAEKEFMPKTMAFDIEAEELEIGTGSILMISVVCGGLKKVLTWKKTPHAKDYVEFCKDEAEMIERFCKIVQKEKPDVLVGYFSDGFDVPYLRARAEKNKMKLDLGVDGSQPTFARGRVPSADIVGIAHIDLFKFIETAYSQYLQSETLSLDEVASELIGEGKHEFGKNHMGKDHREFKENEWKDFFAYNLQDSLLTEKLFFKLWPDFLEFTRVMQEPLFDVSRDRFSQHVENYIIHNLNRFNEIAEHRPTHEQIEERRQREKYGGAFVLQPNPALYENLAVFDFTSLYPSIIASFNLSLSTLLNRAEKYSNEIMDVEMDKRKHNYYFSKKQGFLPSMVEDIIKKRKEAKKQFKENPNALLRARSNAFKILANAAYGYMGFFGARYYCVEAAASTATLGRKFIHEMIDKTNNEGFSVIYADTDGFSLSLNKKSKNETLEFLRRLNSNLPEPMELELEAFYKRGIFVTKRTGEFGAKKKYALIDYTGKMKIRGFETVRRDWCNLAREVQNVVLERILKEGNADSSLEYVKKIIKEIRNRKTEREQLIIRTQLKKAIEEYLSEGPHVAIAKRMIAAGMPVDAGMLVEYYVSAPTTRKKQRIRDKAKLPGEEGDYDIDYYVEHQIIPAVENIFAVFNISKEELIGGKRQKKLGEF